MTENNRHSEFLETGKLELNEGERERNAKSTLACHSTGISGKR